MNPFYSIRLQRELPLNLTIPLRPFDSRRSGHRLTFHRSKRHCEFPDGCQRTAAQAQESHGGGRGTRTLDLIKGCDESQHARPSPIIPEDRRVDFSFSASPEDAS